MTTRVTAEQKILKFFEESPAETWWSLEEFSVPGVSQNTKAARMREMTRKQILETRTRKGTNFSEWRLKPKLASGELPL